MPDNRTASGATRRPPRITAPNPAQRRSQRHLRHIAQWADALAPLTAAR
jgi:hypothetical protein